MDLDFPKLEKKILKFWQEARIFERSIQQRARARGFVFYEGPPTANAKAGLHHVLARVYKDIICRYKTMQGFKVLRKAGWDTHGLPVELEIEKQLGLKSKKDIEKYGIAKFNKKCQDSVWLYKQDWEKLTERIAFWLDMEHPYITYENDYMETLWWIIKQIHQKGLLYQDYKVVPYCSRCGTSLSSHEVALGYKNIKEPTVYVKLKIKPHTYLLVWTTTPWTLPANVAVAVNPEFTYVKAKVDNETFVLAKERLNILGKQYKIIEQFKGKKLLGLKYQPLFKFSKLEKKAWFVVAGDFVSLYEGTGLVHIAPAFGEEDMQIGKKNNLPVLMTVDERGCLTLKVKQWAGIFVKDADPLIIAELQKRNLLFKQEPYEHDYPFCWRCDSPLLYYAKESWFINMQRVKKDLLANNQKINWLPSHLKQGRFGEWLKEVKDWAFSRERYWGTPLPIWQCKKCKHQEVIGSKKDLLSQKFSTNQYYILRHGQTIYQTEKKEWTYPRLEKKPILLTNVGQDQIKKVAKALKDKKIDLIYSSDFDRTRQTAGIVVKELEVKVIFDKRLRDINLGIYHGWKKEEFRRLFNHKDLFWKPKPKGESWAECKKRMLDFVGELEKKHQGKNILIVSHGDPLWLLEGAVKGWSVQQFWEAKEGHKNYINTAEFRKIEYKKFPYDEKGELDFHRPYVDEVRFKCSKCSGFMERVPELIDVWFDSGAMPFAQYHYPFEKEIQFPADYISEAIDQTRGWFYTLLAIATLLDKGAPYKNVISLGHVLDAKGEKMSKSKGNVVDPWYIVEKYGADAVRWYFYTVNQPGDVKFFSEKELAETLKKFIMTYWNSYVFFETYREKSKTELPFMEAKVKKKTEYSSPFQNPKSKNILDKWVISRLNGLIEQVTQKLDRYDITAAGRSIEAFVIDDLSLWYIRRSRKRFKEASATLHHVLLTLSRLTAPFVPFLSEEIYRNLTKKQSCHLEDWPKVDRRLINQSLNHKMEKAREIVNRALAERAKAGIKVRQPLSELRIKERIDQELAELIKEEVNVKKITFGKSLKLDTKITETLKEEGIVREVVRQIQEMRKKAGYKPHHTILVQYFGTKELNRVLTKNRAFILKETKAKDFCPKEKLKKTFDIEIEAKVDQQKLWLAIKKL